MAEQQDSLDRVRRGAHSAAPNRSLKHAREADMVLAGVCGTKGFDASDLILALLSHFAMDAPLGRMAWTLSERAAGVASLTSAHAIGSRLRAAYPFWSVYEPFHAYSLKLFDCDLDCTDIPIGTSPLDVPSLRRIYSQRRHLAVPWHWRRGLKF